ncbi:MAG: hypothetical protein RLZZ245_3413, partial [Verrucomicrobiota bacterium]
QIGSSATSPLTITDNELVVGTSGQDAGVGWASTNSGSVYLGLKLKVDTAQTGGDYFTAFNTGASATNFTGRFFIKRGSSASKFLVGVQVGVTGASPIYGTSELDIGAEYALVLKYNFNAGASNDTAVVYVNPTNNLIESNNNPYIPTVTWAGTSNENSALAAVSIRQGSATSAASFRISRLIVSNDWLSLQPLIPAVIEPTITVNGSLGTFLTSENEFSPSQSLTVTGANLTEGILVTAPEKFEVSADDVTFSSSFSMSASGGTAYVRMAASAVVGDFSGNVVLSSAGADSKNVAVSGTVLAAGTPTFELTDTPLFPFFATFGQVSSTQSFTMTGTNLTGSVTVTPPSGFEISSDGTVFGTAPLVLPPTDGALSQAVSVRVSAAAAAGSLTGNIEVASADLTSSPTVALTATVSLPNFTLALVPASIPENSASPSVATVTIPFARAEDLTVTLSSGNTAAATVPASVVIPATATAVTFDVTPVANPSSFAAQAAVIMVSATNFNSRSETLTVTNVDVAPIASISISSLETPYTQNFDGLGTATIAAAIPGAVGEAANLGAVASSSLNGWYAAKIGGTGAVATDLTASNGSGFSGLVYNYGVSGAPDRALGLLASNSNTMSLGALIKNDSAEAFTGLKFSFTAEFWRNANSAGNTLVFEYGKVDGSTVTTSNFMDPTKGGNLFPPMDIAGPTVAASNSVLDGNDPANQKIVTDVVVPVNLAPGETAFIRWKDSNDANDDDGLAIDNLSIIGVTTGVAAPELSVIGGTYYADQNVKVSNLASYPFGTQIYYTLDGQTPTAASSLYDDALGIDVLDGTGTKTLKAIAISGGVSSSPAISVYVLPTNVANLTALRAMPTGSAIYRVTGEVTFTGGTNTRNTKFFQDSAAGIQVDDNAAIISTVYAAGDNVKDIVGTLAVFAGQLQFTPRVNFGAPVSSGNAVTPLSRTLATLTDADQGMLVTVEEVSFESAGSFFASGATTNINDPSLLGFTGLLK